VERAIEDESRSWGSRKQQIALVAAVLLVASLSIALVLWPGVKTASVQRNDPLSPYQNTRPEVKYVGDAACVRCHAESARTFREHPMGRSLAPIGEDSAKNGEAGTGRPLFERQGLQYSVLHRDGRVFHQEMRRDSQGRIVAQNEAEVQFVLGSGRQGLAYLIERDGFLFQSPLTWYSRKERWDLSPGFEVVNHHFDRPIQPNCLYCHANRAESYSGPVNQYRPPIFQGHAVGCERCHGPGELHVTQPTMVDGKDLTIVNPADLAPALRDGVCAQCHLAGHRRVLRVGRRNEDYRPGLPFHRFWTVLAEPPDHTEDRFVGQMEQMRESRCYRASEGRLGCISCHNPHDFPAPAEKAAYYRGRCLECHAERGCSLPARERLEKSASDDCASCHMPKTRSFDVPHSASANHRIPRQEGGVPRQGGGGSRFMAEPESAARDVRSLVVFYADLLDADERAEVERDRGVALAGEGPEGARLALPLLDAALARRPDDVMAWESKGIALAVLGRFEEASSALQTALTKQPGRESALVEAAQLAEKTNRRADAALYWQRAIAVNPWRSDYHAELAFAYYRDGKAEASAQACRESLRLNATSVKVRKLLVQCYLNLGKLEAARGELETVLAFDPPDRAELLRSFDVQSRSARRTTQDN
jgi:tetratricopeptide (TPR) repeat protein